jgi:hypothetical protein
MNKFRKVAITLALASTAAIHGVSIAHPEHDDPVPVVQTAEVKATLTGSGANTRVIFTKGAEQVSTAGASGTVTLLAAKDKTSYPLSVAPKNAMTSVGLNKLTKGGRAQLHVTFADKTMVMTEVVAK